MSNGRDLGSVRVGPWGASGDSLHERIERDQAHQLNHLIRLGLDLIDAYEVAIKRIDDPILRSDLVAMQEPHRQYVQRLTECVEAIWQSPARHADIIGLLERGRVVVGDHRSGARGILEAMAKNDQSLHQAYREALADPGLLPSARDIIAEALNVEVLHRTYYDRVLARPAASAR